MSCYLLDGKIVAPMPSNKLKVAPSQKKLGTTVLFDCPDDRQDRNIDHY